MNDETNDVVRNQEGNQIVPVVLTDENLRTLLEQVKRRANILIGMCGFLIFGMSIYSAVTFGNQNQLYNQALNAGVISDKKVEAIAQQTADSTVQAVAAQASQAVANMKAEDSATSAQAMGELHKINQQAKDIKVVVKPNKPKK